MFRFLAYVSDYKTLLVLAIVAGLTKFGLNYTFPWLIGSAVDHVMTPAGNWDDRFRWLEVLVIAGIVLSI
ncbi:MAG TPA: hypothetical protein VGB55_04485, partial [Tepidisphaeraceae bacterium]